MLPNWATMVEMSWTSQCVMSPIFPHYHHHHPPPPLLCTAAMAAVKPSGDCPLLGQSRVSSLILPPTMLPTNATSLAPNAIKKAMNSAMSPPPNTSWHLLDASQLTPHHWPPMTPMTPPSNATSPVPDGSNNATSPSQMMCRMVGIKGWEQLWAGEDVQEGSKEVQGDNEVACNPHTISFSLFFSLMGWCAPCTLSCFHSFILPGGPPPGRSTRQHASHMLPCSLFFFHWWGWYLPPFWFVSPPVGGILFFRGCIVNWSSVWPTHPSPFVSPHLLGVYFSAAALSTRGGV